MLHGIDPSTRPPGEFIVMLQAAGVAVLADAHAVAQSRYSLRYGRDALAAAGID